MNDLILASTSPWRRELLERLGLPFTCVAPQVDEAPVQALGLAPGDLAARLAFAKAQEVAERYRNAIVIGSDQVCALEGESFGKPGSAQAAVERLLALAGQPHELVTAVCILHGERRREFVDTTRLVMGDLTREQAERYVAHDQTALMAGGYKLEGRGIALFERIDSADHTAIIGLPLMQLSRELADLGLPVI